MDTVRVVVADDNIQLRDMVAEYLQEQNGIEVVGTAGDGVETLRLVTECEPDVLVLCRRWTVTPFWNGFRR